ncbi:hypothetical protein BGX38DRAFT_1272381 [Terfezia claveryi]|nr:hypothetical protein BGX38DRAFT_1272381 [Terfezia claveryi]
METKEGLRNIATTQEETIKVYEELGRTFNVHIRAQGTELTLIQDRLMVGLNIAIAVIREEGVASRAKDSEDRLRIYKAIGELHKDIDIIKRTIETSKLHPYQAGRLPSAFVSCSISPLPSSSITPKSSSPVWSHPPGLIPQTEARPWPHPHVRQLSRDEIINLITLSPATTEGSVTITLGSYSISLLPSSPIPPPAPEMAEATSEVIDLSNIRDTPSPTPPPSALPFPAGTISALPKEDSAMSRNVIVCNKGTKNPPLDCSKHQHDGPILECGGAKVPPTAAPLVTKKPTGEKRINYGSLLECGGAKGTPTT